MPNLLDLVKEESPKVRNPTSSPPKKPRRNYKEELKELQESYDELETLLVRSKTKNRELESIIDMLSKPLFNELEKDTLYLVIDNYIKGYSRAYTKAKDDPFSKVKKDYEKVLQLRKKIEKL